MVNAIEMLIADKIAQNRFQASHIATGLRLWELQDEEQVRSRYMNYREWRNAGEPSKVAYQNAIAGKRPQAMISKEDSQIADTNTQTP